MLDGRSAAGTRFACMSASVLRPMIRAPSKLPAVGQHLGEAPVVAGRCKTGHDRRAWNFWRIDRTGSRHVEAIVDASGPGFDRRASGSLRAGGIGTAVHRGQTVSLFRRTRRKPVSTIPSGSNSRSCRNAPSGRPETTSITRAIDVDSDAVPPLRPRLEGERIAREIVDHGFQRYIERREAWRVGTLCRRSNSSTKV